MLRHNFGWHGAFISRRALKPGSGEKQPRDALREAAEKFGIGHEMLRQVRILSEESPDRIDAIRAGLSTVTREFKAHKTDEKLRDLERRHAETLAATPKDAQTGVVSDINELVAAGKKFGCIYADPPWLYDNQGTRAATSNHYSGLTVAQFCELPVRQLAADDAHLHLWTTNAFLRQAFDIIDAWGFEFRSTFIWTKPQMGIGNYWRNSHEILLTAIRGDAKRFNDHSMMSWLQCDRAAHSAKPEQVRAMIERASPGPYFEMFGRRVAQGWTVWGN